MTVKNIFDTVDIAKMNACNAEIEFVKQYGEPFYCGSAWVEVKVDRLNSKIAKELIAAGFRKSHIPRTLEISNWGGSNTQSLAVKEVGAQRFADIMKYYGFNAYIRTWAN